VLKILPPLLILICVVAFMWPALSPGHALLPAGDLASMSPWSSVLQPSSHQWNPLMWDAVAQFYPWRSLYHDALHNGQLPLWNRYQFCGAPLYANVQSAVFYPPNLIFYVMDPARAFGFAAALHLFLAGLFAFLLARHIGASRAGATVSGIVYSLCAFNVTWLELPSFVSVAAWLPLVLLLIRVALLRGSAYAAMGAGLALGLALLAGHFQIAFYVAVAAFGWGMWCYFDLGRPLRSFRLAGIVALTAISLAAIQILPSMELAALSHRAGHASVSDYFRYAGTGLPSMNLLTAFVPDFFGNPSTNSVFWGMGNYAEFALYVGTLPLILAIASLIFDRRKRPVKFFGVAALLSLLFALGSPLNALFYFGVPGWSSTGSPARILLLYCFSVSMLAGFGATTFTTNWAQRGRTVLAGRMSMTVLVLGVTAVLFTTAALYTWIALSHFPEISADETILGYGVLIALGMIFVAASILVWRAADKMGPRVSAVLILVVTIADLAIFGFHYNAISSVDAVYPKTRGTAFLQDYRDHDRIMPINPTWSMVTVPPAVMPPNSAMVYHLDDVQGYDSLFPGYYKSFARDLQGRDPSPIENGNMVLFKGYTPQAARYAKYIVSARTIDDRSLLLVHEDDFLVYENPNALPRAEVVAVAKADSHRAVRWSRDDLNSVELRVSSTQGATLILRDTMYPGWRATADELDIEIHPVEKVFRSVSVPPGHVSVAFEFAPASLRIGMYITMLCLGVCTACTVIKLGARSDGRSA
jgi:hypothetical protein